VTLAQQDFAADLAALDWQIELGATEAIGDDPVMRYEAAVETPQVVVPKDTSAPTPAAAIADTPDDGIAEATRAAAGAGDLAQLRTALGRFEQCDLKKGARNLVFADGNPAARVMIIAEAPGRDEDLAGLPFVGQAGQMLDKMFAAIDLSRTGEPADQAIYITNVLPWRPPQNRNPEPDEIAMMLPFVNRHIALAAPDFIVLMGNIACQALLGKTGITRLRGQWATVQGVPALPMFHPAYLLRTPAAKREAWADLLALKARLKG